MSPSNDNGEKNKKKTGRLVVLEMLFDSFFFPRWYIKRKRDRQRAAEKDPPKKEVLTILSRLSYTLCVCVCDRVKVFISSRTHTHTQRKDLHKGKDRHSFSRRRSTTDDYYMILLFFLLLLFVCGSFFYHPANAVMIQVTL